MLIAFLLASQISSPHQVLSAGTEAALLSVGRVRPVVVDKRIRQDLVYISPNGASIETQISALTCALDASQLETESGTMIIRTKADQLRIRQRRSDARLAWIEKYLKDVNTYRKRALTGRSIGEALVNSVGERTRLISAIQAGKASPESLGLLYSGLIQQSEPFAEKLIRRIGLRKIADLPIDSAATVWEDQPAYKTKPLPDHQDLDSEYLDQRAKLSLPTLTSEQRQQFVSAGISPEMLSSNALEPIAKTRLSVFSFVSSISINVESFDRNGQRLFDIRLSPCPSGEVFSDKAISASHPAYRSKLSSPIRSESLAAAAYPRNTSDLAPDWLLHPDRSEPLNLFVRDAVEALARDQTTGCFAIWVSDGLWNLVKPCIVGNSVNLDALRANLNSQEPYEIVTIPSGVAMRPVDAEVAEQCQVSRKVLANFAQEMHRQPDVRLIAKLYRDIDSTQAWLAPQWVFGIQNTGERPLGFDAAKDFYRLVGSISDVNWSELIRRGRMTLGQLGITDAFYDYILSDGFSGLQSTTPLPEVLKFAPDVTPAGVRDDSVIELKVTVKRQVKVYTIGTPLPKSWDDFRSLGEFLCEPARIVKQEDGTYIYATPRDDVERRIDPKLFQLGTGTDFNITIYLDPRIEVTQSIHGGDAPEGIPFRFRDLSQAERDTAWINGQKEAIQQRIDNSAVNLHDPRRKTQIGGIKPPLPL